MKTSVELREKRAGLVKEARVAIDKAKVEDRDLTPEESQGVDQLMEAVDKLKEQIDRLEKLENAEEEDEAPAERSGRPMPAESRSHTPAMSADRERVAYRHWLRTGEVRPEMRGGAQRAAEFRDTIVSTDAKGGFLITPVQVSADIVQIVQDLVFIRQLCAKAGSITTVTEAKKLGIRKLITHMADANWTTEVVAVTEDTTMALDRRDLEPMLLSKLAKASIRTLMLTNDAEALINAELGYKFAITEEKAFISGTGSSQPLGIFTASASGISTARDVTASSATTFTADDLINVKFNLKAAYMHDPATAWIVSRPFVKTARKLKIASTTGGDDLQYIWQPGITEGAPDRMLDIPYYMSENAPSTFTTGLYVAVLGCFRFYRIAQLAEVMIQRLTELYAATNEVGFIGRRWVDGAPVQEEAFSRLKLA